MEELSPENKIYLMIDMDDECVFSYEAENGENIQEKPNAIVAYADIEGLSNVNYRQSEKRKDIFISENGIIEIDRNDLKENSFYFVLQSKTRIANFTKMASVKFDTNKNFYYMKFDKDANPIQFEDDSTIKAFDSQEELNAFKQKQQDEPAPEQPAEQPQTEQQTEQPVEPVTQAESEQTQQPEQPKAKAQPADATDSNDSIKPNQKKDTNSQKTNNKNSKSKWIFMIAGGLLVAAGIAISFLTFGFGVIPLSTAAAALSVAIPSALGAALVTGASTQFDNKPKSKFAIAAIVVGCVFALSAILLSVFTFGLGIGAVAFAGAVTAGFAIGIPAAIGVGAITAGSIAYDRLQKNGYSPIDNKNSDNILDKNSIIDIDQKRDESSQPTQETKVPDLTTNDGENAQTQTQTDPINQDI